MRLTLAQVLPVLGAGDELVIVEQTKERSKAYESYLGGLASRGQVRVVCLTPNSLTVARNVGAHYARNEVLLFLDDDVDADPDLLHRHRRYYEDPGVCAVAGSYHPGTRTQTWSPPGRKAARFVAGAHFSVRRASFLDIMGSDPRIGGNFMFEDFELADRLRRVGRIANGRDCVVLHRDPIGGGCGNTSVRPLAWYEATWRNRLWWRLKQPFPVNIMSLPYHLYRLVRCHQPPRTMLGWWKSVTHLALPALFSAFRMRLAGEDHQLVPPEFAMHELQVRDGCELVKPASTSIVAS